MYSHDMIRGFLSGYGYALSILERDKKFSRETHILRTELNTLTSHYNASKNRLFGNGTIQ